MAERIWLRLWDWLQQHHACPCVFGLRSVCEWSEDRFMLRAGYGERVSETAERAQASSNADA